MNTEIMLDLETMSSKSNAAIVSIGAVKMNMKRLRIVDRFSINVSLQSSVDAGLNLSPSTIIWWMNQSEEARKAFQDNPVLLKDALSLFSVWVGEDQPVWGNGATFDNVVLRTAYEAIGEKCPWSYRNDRCYRTLKNLVPVTPPRNNKNAHNALKDAEWQAWHLFRIYREGGLAK